MSLNPKRRPFHFQRVCPAWPRSSDPKPPQRPKALSMPILALSELRFGPRSHISALWWIWLLYRNPSDFHSRLRDDLHCPHVSTIQHRLIEKKRHSIFLTAMRCFVPPPPPIALTLLLHALPYLFLTSMCGTAMSATFGLSSVGSGTLQEIAIRTYPGFLMGGLIAVALAVALVLFGKTDGETSLIGGIVSGTSAAVLSGIVFGLDSAKVGEYAIPCATAFIVGFSVGMAWVAMVLCDHWFYRSDSHFLFFAASIWLLYFAPCLTAPALVGLVIGSTRCYYYPLHIPFTCPWIYQRFKKWHPFSWDMVCVIPCVKWYSPFAEFETLRQIAMKSTSPIGCSVDYEELLEWLDDDDSIGPQFPWLRKNASSQASFEDARTTPPNGVTESQLPARNHG
jgi:hypothetical protein